MKNWSKTLFTFLLCFMPHLVFAQATERALDFTPSATDLSVTYLGSIFGVVDGVLSGSGSQILGQMFGVFNAAVLTLGGIIIAYTFVVSTINTAQEGEILGKKWSSVWIPLRTAAGVGLLLPKASGYCMIQVFIMWVVLQGVGVGNLVWNKALDYLASGNPITVPFGELSTAGDRSVILGLSGQLLKSEVCMFTLRKGLEAQRQNEIKAGSNISPVPSFLELPQINSTMSSLPIPYIPATNKDWSSYNGTCGELIWNTTQGDNENVRISRSAAVRQMFYDLAPVAQVIVNNNEQPVNLKLPIGKCNSSKGSCQPDQWSTNSLLTGIELYRPYLSYRNIVYPALRAYHQQQDNNAPKFINDAKSAGWIMAGRYYFDLASLNQRLAEEDQNYPSLDAALPPDLCGTDRKPERFYTLPNCTSEINPLVNGNELRTYITDATNMILTPGNQSTLDFTGTTSVGGRFASQLTAVLFPIVGVAQGFAALLNSQWSNTNPIIAIAIVGSNMINVASSIWIRGAISFGAIGLVLGAIATFSFADAVTSLLLWLVPILSSLLIAIFVAGGTMAYYIPLIPFIIFTFAVIGWFIGVIEAMLAAPLVALGITHPEGAHPIIGKAEPAVMLLVSVFLRPAMTIIGYIVGIILSYIGIWFINSGFGYAYKGLISSGGITGLAWLFSWIAAVIIYTGIIMAVVNQAFSLIHVIPDQVFRWLGGAGQQFGETIGRSEAAVKGYVGGGLKAGGEAASAGAGAQAKQTLDKRKGSAPGKVTGQK